MVFSCWRSWMGKETGHRTFCNAAKPFSDMYAWSLLHHCFFLFHHLVLFTDAWKFNVWVAGMGAVGEGQSLRVRGSVARRLLPYERSTPVFPGWVAVRAGEPRRQTHHVVGAADVEEWADASPAAKWTPVVRKVEDGRTQVIGYQVWFNANAFCERGYYHGDRSTVVPADSLWQEVCGAEHFLRQKLMFCCKWPFYIFQEKAAVCIIHIMHLSLDPSNSLMCMDLAPSSGITLSPSLGIVLLHR